MVFCRAMYVAWTLRSLTELTMESVRLQVSTELGALCSDPVDLLEKLESLVRMGVRLRESRWASIAGSSSTAPCVSECSSSAGDAASHDESAVGLAFSSSCMPWSARVTRSSTLLLLLLLLVAVDTVLDDAMEPEPEDEGPLLSVRHSCLTEDGDLPPSADTSAPNSVPAMQGVGGLLSLSCSLDTSVDPKARPRCWDTGRRSPAGRLGTPATVIGLSLWI